MITEKEKEELKQEIVEQVLLILPGAIGNLITNHITMSKINKGFYDKYPEFSKHKDVVASVVEDVEGVNTFSKYEDILEKSVPKIRETIAMKKPLNMDKVSKPNRITDLGEL